MTHEEKQKWLSKATPDQLLENYVSLIAANRYGINSEDIKMTHDELIRRMNAHEEVS